MNLMQGHVPFKWLKYRAGEAIIMARGHKATCLGPHSGQDSVLSCQRDIYFLSFILSTIFD